MRSRAVPTDGLSPVYDETGAASARFLLWLTAQTGGVAGSRVASAVYARHERCSLELVEGIVERLAALGWIAVHNDSGAVPPLVSPTGTGLAEARVWDEAYADRDTRRRYAKAALFAWWDRAGQHQSGEPNPEDFLWAREAFYCGRQLAFEDLEYAKDHLELPAPVRVGVAEQGAGVFLSFEQLAQLVQASRPDLSESDSEVRQVRELAGDDAVERRTETYKGIKGPAEGTPQVFRRAVSAMCAVDARTVFLAGRDADLPPFLETIDRTSSCERAPDGEPTRILRVSTGRDPVTETPGMRAIADRNNIEIVTAAAVDAPLWHAGRSGDDEVPKAFAPFAESYDERFGQEQADALNDGYAVMYHDALTAVSTAVSTAVAAARDGGIDPVSHNDVYDQLRRGSPLEHCAAGCVPGASGVFTFADESAGEDAGAQHEAAAGLWPVCKPVPVVTFPQEQRNRSPLYRTYQKEGENTCPPP